MKTAAGRREDVSGCVELLKEAGALKQEGGSWVLDSFAPKSLRDADSPIYRCYAELVIYHRQCVRRAGGSNKYPSYRVDLDCLLSRGRAEEGGEMPQTPPATLEEVVGVARERFGASPFARLQSLSDAFSSISDLLLSADRGELGGDRRHILLVGPPGAGKSFLLSLFDHPQAPIFYGATTTPKGLVQYLAETPIVLLRFDELDKANKATVDAFLHILSEGRLVFAEKRLGRMEVRVDAPLLAAANYDFLAKRSQSWEALLDRVVLVELTLKREDHEAMESIVREKLPDLAGKIIDAFKAGKLSLRTVERYLSFPPELHKLIERDLEARLRLSRRT
jgi:hypothetical protein